MKIFPHQELTKALIGIYYDVYNELGYGFLERVYHNAFLIELRLRGYEFESQKKLNVFFKKEIVGYFVSELPAEMRKRKLGILEGKASFVIKYDFKISVEEFLNL